jgi:hypothetical protein
VGLTAHKASPAVQKDVPVRGPIESPAVVDIIRSLQTQTGNLCPCRQPGRRVGLALSSNHRVYFTSQTIEAMDTDSRFDMIF